MSIICIANHKGGTGKTSLTINIGVYFAREKKRVLIIDMDPQGHIAPGLGIDIGYDDRSIADIISNQEDISSIIIPTSVERLEIAPSNIKLSLVNENLHTTFKRETRLKKTVESVLNDDKYDLILVDCPPSLGPLVENALMIVDYCIIPCEPSSRSIDGLADFVGKIKEVREGGLEDRWFIVLSRVKKIARLTNEAIEEKLKSYKDRILSSRIYEREAINQAQMAGVPVFYFPRGSLATQNFAEIGREIEEKCQIR